METFFCSRSLSLALVVTFGPAICIAFFYVNSFAIAYCFAAIAFSRLSFSFYASAAFLYWTKVFCALAGMTLRSRL